MFFAATEAQLLGATAFGSGGTTSNLGKAANAGSTGALVIHSFAGTQSHFFVSLNKKKTNSRPTAIVSFLAAFFLISHTIHEAKLEHPDSYNSSNGHRSHHIRERSAMEHDARIVNVCRFNLTLPPFNFSKGAIICTCSLPRMGSRWRSWPSCVALGIRWVLSSALSRQGSPPFISLLLLS